MPNFNRFHVASIAIWKLFCNILFRDKYVYIYPVDGDLLYDETQFVVDRIDEIARIGFPLAFIATCATYYVVYIYL